MDIFGLRLGSEGTESKNGPGNADLVAQTSSNGYPRVAFDALHSEALSFLEEIERRWDCRTLLEGFARRNG